jgi:hypothetical protein
MPTNTTATTNATTPNTPTYFQQPQPTMSPAISKPETQQPPPTATTLPYPRKHSFPTPLLRLQLNDLALEGSSIFLSLIHGHEDLAAQVQNVLNLLYDPPKLDKEGGSETEIETNTETETEKKKRPSTTHRPPTRSVTFILHDFEGVAYTTGMDLDSDHKEIHISTTYILNCARKADKRHELLGVICHELVHCFQWNANGTCPSGLIEGIADFVRLRAGLGAAHWKQEASGEWDGDGGYQKTGYFLQWLEGKFGDGTVEKLNACLREGEWDGKRVFGQCCKGERVEELWEEYREELEGRKKGSDEGEDGPAKAIPTHPAKKE